MKILYIGHTYTIRANQEKIAALAKVSSSNGPVEITLVTPHAWRGPLYRNKTDRFDTSLAPKVAHHIVRAFFIGKESGYVFAPSVFSLIARVQPDIVHVEQGAYALSYAQILFGLKLFSPNSRALFFTWWNLPYGPHGVKRIAERFNLAHSAAAIAGNVAARNILQEHGFKRQIQVLPQLGIDVSKFSSGTPNRISQHFTIGYAGRITEEKGVLDLVQAIATLPNREKLQLYLIGAGSALTAVQGTARELGVPVLYHGAVRNEELPEHLARMDVLVLPSRTTPIWVEQFGHILLEAMAVGIPVIGSSSGEIPNVIGDAGIIFDEGNARALADALELLRNNRLERERFAALGKNRVTRYYTHERIADVQMQLYDWMMERGVPVGTRERGKRTGAVEQTMETSAL